MERFGPDARWSQALSISRAVLAWGLLIVIVIVVFGFLGNYWAKSGDDGATPAGETTGTLDATSTSDATGTAAPTGDGADDGAAEEGGTLQVLVLADGLNLRSGPGTDTDVIRKLDKDLKLELIEESAGWYHVRDADGTEGWVAAGGAYTALLGEGSGQ